MYMYTSTYTATVTTIYIVGMHSLVIMAYLVLTMYTAHTVLTRHSTILGLDVRGS